MLDWTHCDVVERRADRVGGAWVFKDTRIPVAALFENLESGATVEQFAEWFQGLTLKQVRGVLAFAERSLIEV